MIIRNNCFRKRCLFRTMLLFVRMIMRLVRAFLRFYDFFLNIFQFFFIFTLTEREIKVSLNTLYRIFHFYRIISWNHTYLQQQHFQPLHSDGYAGFPNWNPSHPALILQYLQTLHFSFNSFIHIHFVRTGHTANNIIIIVFNFRLIIFNSIHSKMVNKKNKKKPEKETKIITLSHWASENFPF